MSRFRYLLLSLLTGAVIYGALAGFAWFFVVGAGTGIAANVLLAIVGATSVLNAALTVRRLHDLGRPGWHYWLQAVPFYNLYIAFLLFFKAGDPGPNQHGENPLLLAEMAAMDTATDAFVDEDFDADTNLMAAEADDFDAEDFDADDFDADRLNADPTFDTSEVFEATGQGEAVSFGVDPYANHQVDEDSFDGDGFEAASLESDRVYAPVQDEEAQLFDTEESLRADFNATPDELEAYNVTTEEEPFSFASDDPLEPDLDPRSF